MSAHGHPMSSLLNCLLMLGVCVPPALYVAALRQNCSALPRGAEGSWVELGWQWLQTLPGPQDPLACTVYLEHPRLFVNLVYFVAVDVGFYVIYLLQGSTWLIDPHWQLIPLCIAGFFFSHPNAAQGHPRAYLSLGLLLCWAGRLFYNYLRREGWQFGGGEDWRYAQMRKDHGHFFVISQFFVVSVAQHGMLVGLTMPLEPAMQSGGAPLGAHDAVAAALCVCGMLLSCVADNQLHTYMHTKDKPLLLDTGLWRYSRHPNHFGEQTWWLGVLYLAVAAAGGLGGFLACGAECWVVAFGVCFNHPLDTCATLPLIEARMLARPERAALFRAYQQRTPLLVPWWPAEKAAGKAA